jgi:hypothetical protein
MEEHADEIEVEAAVVLRKRMKLRSTDAVAFTGAVSVFECERPYCIILHILNETLGEKACRMDVFREDLARELRQWLEGKVIHHPAIIASQHINDVISKFVKFGKTPLQSDLIMWIISRSEITWGASPSLVFGSDSSRKGNTDGPEEHGIYPIAESPETTKGEKHNGTGGSPLFGARATGSPTAISSPMNTQKLCAFGRSESATSGRKSTGILRTKSQVVRASTKDLLGCSKSLQTLQKHSAGGRSEAPKVYDNKGWTSHHFSLVEDLEEKRREIEDAVETRRKNLEIAKARHDMTINKYMTIKAAVEEEHKMDSWVNQAKQELEVYSKIYTDIERDILRQKTRAQR